MTDSRSHRTAAWCLVALVCAAPALTACGGDDAALDRDDFQSVFDAAMAAVAAKDLDALWPLLTEEGRRGVERNLRDWQRRLRDPEQGPRILARIRERRGDVPAAEVDVAARGTIRDAWVFFLEADPRPADPKRRGLQMAPDGRTVTLLYEVPNGDSRPVRLRRLAAGWYVDDLQL